MRYAGQAVESKAISSKYVLICEGWHDEEFFLHLIRERGIAPNFDVRACENITAGYEGIDSLTDALNALPAISGFQNVEAILIAADNDLDPAKAFTKISELIKASLPQQPYAVPSTPFTKAGTNPVVVVMMIPWLNVKGSLDTMCLEAAMKKAPAIASCVEKFAKCAKTNEWPITKQAKMKLRSLISAAYDKNPYLPPSWVWKNNTSLVPLSDPVFNQVASFLSNFPDFVK